MSIVDLTMAIYIHIFDIFKIYAYYWILIHLTKTYHNNLKNHHESVIPCGPSSICVKKLSLPPSRNLFWAAFPSLSSERLKSPLRTGVCGLETS